MQTRYLKRSANILSTSLVCTEESDGFGEVNLLMSSGEALHVMSVAESIMANIIGHTAIDQMIE